MRLRPLVFTLIFTFVAFPTFAAREREAPREPRVPKKIVKIIKRIIQSLDNPYILDPRP
jgi:hypothetical protein